MVPGSYRGVSTPVAGVLLVAIGVALAIVVAVVVAPQTSESPERITSGSVEFEFDSADGTFGDSGDGGVCAGGDYRNDDSVTVRVTAGEPVPDSALTIRIGSQEATYPTCSGGATTLDVFPDSRETVSAGTVITVYEGDGSNAIRSGASVKVIYEPADEAESYVVAKRQVP